MKIFNIDHERFFSVHEKVFGLPKRYAGLKFFEKFGN